MSSVSFASETESTAVGAIENSADHWLKLGNDALQLDRYNDAAEHFEHAVKAASAIANPAMRIAAMNGLAVAYLGLGHHQRAITMLEDALPVAESMRDSAMIVRLRTTLGIAYTLIRIPSRAESHLFQALAVAEENSDAKAQAVVLNNLGNLWLSQKEHLKAGEAFEKSAALAEALHDDLLVAQALCNAASTKGLSKLTSEAIQLNEEAVTRINQLPSSPQRAFLMLRVGRTYEQAAETEAAAKDELFEKAARAYEEGVRIAGEVAELKLKSYGLGFLGHVEELRGNSERALKQTRQALFAAQQTQHADSLYRWQWQLGRILRSQGNVDGALDAYRCAVETLRYLRSDLMMGCGNHPLGGSFREFVGPVYYELADLLLRKANDLSNAGEVQAVLSEARNTVEKLKTVELQDYMQDDCVNLVQQVDIARVATNTAVVYLIPLTDRTEILLDLASGLHRHTEPVSDQRLTEEVNRFRYLLEKKTTHQYLKPGAQLYDWLIRPIHQTLTNQHIDTLVFVPDGALRTIPMAALFDGEKFLLNEFAVAVTPGLSLMEPRPFERKNVRLMLNGLSKSVQDFAALPYVPAELETLSELYASRDTLLDEQFQTNRFTSSFAGAEYSIVHIASHGEFSSDVRNTFVLAYDGKLTLDQLETLISPRKFRGKPVELLALSACQTAAGDDRAALGLAGVAVKAGARSAFATLWNVNDQSTSLVVTEFYAQLRADPSLTKAQALRKAQCKLMQDLRYDHPGYWAPYLIIGNWL